MAGLGSDMADQKQKMEEALTQLQEVKNKLTTDINQLKALVDEVKKATATNAANLESLRQNTIEKITAVKRRWMQESRTWKMKWPDCRRRCNRSETR